MSCAGNSKRIPRAVSVWKSFSHPKSPDDVSRPLTFHKTLSFALTLSPCCSYNLVLVCDLGKGKSGQECASHPRHFSTLPRESSRLTTWRTSLVSLFTSSSNQTTNQRMCNSGVVDALAHSLAGLALTYCWCARAWRWYLFSITCIRACCFSRTEKKQRPRACQKLTLEESEALLRTIVWVLWTGWDSKRTFFAKWLLGIRMKQATAMKIYNNNTRLGLVTDACWSWIIVILDGGWSFFIAFAEKSVVRTLPMLRLAAIFSHRNRYFMPKFVSLRRVEFPIWLMHVNRPINVIQVLAPVRRFLHAHNCERYIRFRASYDHRCYGNTAEWHFPSILN